ncbi:MAG: hypothetical protein U0516_04265 [Candidatus Saccharibacteria bacterium]
MAANKPVTIEPVTFADSRWFYRLLEIIPGALTWSILLGPIILSLVFPIAVAYFIIAFDLLWLMKSIRMSFALVLGYRRTKEAENRDWNMRLQQLSNIPASLEQAQAELKQAPNSKIGRLELDFLKSEVERLQLLASNENIIMQPKEIYHLVIMPMYNEPLEIVEPALKAILDSEFSMKKVYFVLAYEERGGADTKTTAKLLEEKYADKFYKYRSIEHPDGIAGEIKGKGPNITHAARIILKDIIKSGIDPDNVVVTTIDCDNKVHKKYLSSLTYHYAINPNRRHTSFQPLALYFNNIWDVPAPMRVLAVGNSFWVMIESVRKQRLRNFASHAQGLSALIDTDFWSLTSPVEDGHQFYRSYFTFNGDYMVEPLFVPIYQDAVLASNYHRTFIAQFKQLQRWAYGISDFPYVVKNSIKNKNIPLGDKLIQIGRLLEGHLSWSTAPLILTFAAWAPLYLNASFSQNVIAHQLPVIASRILTLATIGLFTTIWISFIMIPKRPSHYPKWKMIFMVLQWVLVPITAIVFGAFAAINAQTRLMLGKYLGFYVTEKAVKKR